LRTANYLASFAVNDFKNSGEFLKKLPNVFDNTYDNAIEFRHPSWGTEGLWEMLRHYNIAAAVIIGSAAKENLQSLSNIIVTADPSFIILHGRNIGGHYWYNLFSTRIEAVDRKSRSLASYWS
jgi:uncharacterized protein YecE (DUF72 family)